MGRSGRKPDPSSEISEDAEVVLVPLVEPDMVFEKRTDEVQEIIKRIILLGRRKGRPSKKEGEFEQAA